VCAMTNTEADETDGPVSAVMECADLAPGRVWFTAERGTVSALCLAAAVRRGGIYRITVEPA
jgi:hypothetical protein